jgi:hypothetical protein
VSTGDMAHTVAPCVIYGNRYSELTCAVKPRIISLLEMLERYASRYIAIGVYLEKAASFLGNPSPGRSRVLKEDAHISVDMRERLREIDKQREGWIAEWGNAQQQIKEQLFGQLSALRADCFELGLKCSVAQIDRLLAAPEVGPDQISEGLSELLSRLYDELRGQKFFAIEPNETQFYEDSLSQWGCVIGRFSEVRDDVEEASKCFAFERYSACIFHLMRVTEAGVVALGRIVDPKDYKPQFGSILRKLDTLSKTKWQDWPDDARPHKQLFVDVLPRLHAVKDSWRDKASHFDAHIIPLGAISNRERALDIYNCTLSLMRLLAERLAAPCDDKSDETQA